ncbi:hypothetical protein ACH3XW_42650 [Acanthocheilonema viteae]
MFLNILVTVFIIFVTTTFTVSKACEDSYGQCGKVVCTDPIGKKICAKTCGLCGTTSSTIATPECPYLCRPLEPICELIGWIVGTIPNGFCFRCQQCKMFYAAGFVTSFIYFAFCNAKECKDESVFCNATVIDVCSLNEIKKYCPKTCSLCGPDISTSTAAPAEECSDQWTNCTKVEADVCQSDSDVARIFCFKTCSNCTASTSTTIQPNVATHFDSLLTVIYCTLFVATMKFMV